MDDQRYDCVAQEMFPQAIIVSFMCLSCVCIGKQRRIIVYPSPCLPASCLSTAIKSYSLPCQTGDGFLVIRLPLISPSSCFLIHAGLVFGFFYHAENWRALKEMGWGAETGVGEVNHTSKKSLSSWLISSRGGRRTRTWPTRTRRSSQAPGGGEADIRINLIIFKSALAFSTVRYWASVLDFFPPPSSLRLLLTQVKRRNISHVCWSEVLALPRCCSLSLWCLLQLAVQDGAVIPIRRPQQGRHQTGEHRRRLVVDLNTQFWKSTLSDDVMRGTDSYCLLR